MKFKLKAQIQNLLKFAPLLLVFILYLVLMPKAGHGYDLYCWKTWSIYIFNEGLGKIYNSGTDYLPLYHYVLWFFALFQGNVIAIESNIFDLKVITIIFDFIAGFFLIKLLIEKYGNNYQVITLSLFYFLNIAVFYNSVIWGQVDGIMACFVFLSFYYAYKNKILASLVFYVLAINFKLQAIIFLPLIGLILLPSFVKSFNYSRLLKWVITPLIVQLLILLPFIFAGSVHKIWDVVDNSFGKYPVVSMNAYNVWEFLVKGDKMAINDSELFLGVTYQKWGMFLFFVFAFLAILPLVIAVINSIKSRLLLNLKMDKLLLIGALIPLLFFYFNTQMHERYSHPALLFVITYCILYNRLLVGLLASMAYFLNLEGVFHFLQLPNYGTLIFDRIFISSLFLLAIIMLFVELFKLQPPPKHFRHCSFF